MPTNQRKILIDVLKTVIISLALSTLILIYNPNVITQAAALNRPTQTSNNILIILILTFLLLVVVTWRLKKIIIFYKYFVKLLLFLLLFNLILLIIPPPTFSVLLLLIFITSILFYEITKFKNINTQTIIFVVIFAVTAAIFIQPLYIIFILIVASVYDIIMVRLGWMQRMAGAVIKLKLPLLYIQGTDVNVIKKLEGKLKADNKVSALGGGDVMLPLALIISNYLYGYEIFSVILIILLFIGILIDFKISKKYNKAIAALPIITLFMIGFTVMALLW